MLEQVRTYLVILGSVAAWAFGLSTVWNKLLARVNGLGGRVKKVEDADSYLRGRLDEIKEKTSDLELKHSEQLALLREAANEREASLRERLAAVETSLAILRDEKHRGD